jgi:hypothetical protein
MAFLFGTPNLALGPSPHKTPAFHHQAAFFLLRTDLVKTTYLENALFLIYTQTEVKTKLSNILAQSLKLV